MLNTSPIDTWEGAGAFFNYAGTGGAAVCFWIMVVLCIVPLFVALKAESAAEAEHD